MPDIVKILIVDDQEIMRDALKTILFNKPGLMVVETAKNGMQAVEKIKLNHVDLVLMDLEMPFMDGIKATKVILGSDPEIKVLVLTMHDDLELLSQIIIAGGSGYLIKPVGVNQLIEAIKAVMNGKYYLGFRTSMDKPDLGSWN